MSVTKNVIHRFWTGKEMPDEYKEFGNEWARLNPDWTVKDWTFDEAMRWVDDRTGGVIEDLIERDNGKGGVEQYVQMADVFAYTIISQFGGIYVNTDIQPLRSMKYLFRIHNPGDAPYAGFEDQGSLISNAMMGGARNDPFWQFIVDGLPDHYWANRLGEMNQVTGPIYLTKKWSEWNIERDRPSYLRVFPEDTFNPVHWKSIEPGGDAYGKFDPNNLSVSTVGAHHWGHKKVGRSNYVESGTPPL